MSRNLEVWAPNAGQVDVIHHDRRTPLSQRNAGWHVGSVDLETGDDYAFSLDSGEPRPDPRSGFQPTGVHGPSRIVETAAYKWQDSAWHGLPLNDAVIYELHVGTFSADGTFDGAAERLAHLVDLGVNTVELMPVAAFPGERGWGYDGVDLYAPHAAYGGPEGLRRFVDACHALGLAVVMDVVYNHLGPEGDYLSEFAPYFTERYATPWGSAVNVDGPDSDQVRAFFVDNALMWLRDYHCDGLRLDAVHAIIDTSATHLVEEIVARVEGLAASCGRRLWVIAESDANDPRLVSDRERGGFGVDAQWSDNFHHALHAALTGERQGYYADFGSLDDVCVALRQGFVFTGQYSTYRRRRFGRDTDGLPLNRFVGYAQNHDQVGNRAVGERLCHLVSPGRARIAAALTLLSPFVPLLFQGEEWAASTPFQYFTDLGDPALRRAVSRGRRSEFHDFGWDPAAVPDPQDPATFQRSRLRWEELETAEHAEMLDWYRSLIRLRRAMPGFGDGDRGRVAAEAQQGLLRYRYCGVEMVCNLRDEPATVTKPPGWVVALSADGVDVDTAATTLGPDSMIVWREPPGG